MGHPQGDAVELRIAQDDVAAHELAHHLKELRGVVHFTRRPSLWVDPLVLCLSAARLSTRPLVV